ncbi:hypothetical protein PILCRDRAFT_816304 [Piloderma croceum F 1598]|uniref:Uncharacterized protein n=1 Tax=Piloderma croceum (strain F 1598) TaxID=765440 RepID=A0A0C3G3C5_PILCF|nr:hypothetical protein PILCRDRAFT_816304 [Piloderma croceum F 1598]
MLDGNQNVATTTTIAPETTGVETYNVSIYDIQILSFDPHNVSVHILSGSLWFDYAAVNDTRTESPSASEPPHSYGPRLLSASISTPIPPSHDSASASPEMSTASADTGFSSNPLSSRSAAGETKRPTIVRILSSPSSGHTSPINA